MKNQKQQLKRLLACAACLVFGVAPYGAAQVVVVDNSPPNHLTGNNMGIAFQAEDFTLAAGASVTGIRFWSLELDNAYRGYIGWSFYRDNGEGPGDLLAAGIEAGMRSELGSYLGLREFRNDLTLNFPVPLGPGHYWLQLHNGALGDQGDPNEFLWESAAPNGSRPGMESFVFPVVWTPNGTEHAFQLLAVAEPAQVLMLMIGMTLLACLKRRDEGSDNFS